jgi:hypothetical protein
MSGDSNASGANSVLESLFYSGVKVIAAVATQPIQGAKTHRQNYVNDTVTQTFSKTFGLNHPKGVSVSNSAKAAFAGSVPGAIKEGSRGLSKALGADLGVAVTGLLSNIVPQDRRQGRVYDTSVILATSGCAGLVDTLIGLPLIRWRNWVNTVPVGGDKSFKAFKNMLRASTGMEPNALVYELWKGFNLAYSKSFAMFATMWGAKSLVDSYCVPYFPSSMTPFQRKVAVAGCTGVISAPVASVFETLLVSLHDAERASGRVKTRELFSTFVSRNGVGKLGRGSLLYSSLVVLGTSINTYFLAGKTDSLLNRSASGERGI